MLIVVLYHCCLYWTGTWFVGTPVVSSNLLSIAAQWMNSFHIYGFALVSGYLFFFLRHEKGKYSKFFPFVANKAKRLLIPYAFVALIWVIPFAVYFFRYDAMEIIKRFVLGTSPSQLWFLLMLFDVFVIFYPLSNFFQKRHVLGAVVVILIYGVGLIGSSILPNLFQIFRACTYVPLFWLGFKIRQCGSGWLRKIPALVWLLGDVALFAVTQYLSKMDGIIFKLFYQGSEFLLHIVGALLAFLILQKIADLFNRKERKTIGFLGKNSMPVYLVHQQIVYVFIVLLNGKVNPFIHAGINFIGAMLISLLLSVLLMKFKWTRFLIGEK